MPRAPRPRGGLLLELIPGLLVRFSITFKKFPELKVFLDARRAYFYLSSPKKGFIKRHGCLNRIFVTEFNICKAFWMSIILVT